MGVAHFFDFGVINKLVIKCVAERTQISVLKPHAQRALCGHDVSIKDPAGALLANVPFVNCVIRDVLRGVRQFV